MQDQPLTSELTKPAVADPAVQPSHIPAAISSTDVGFSDDHQITLPRSPTAEIHPSSNETNKSPQQHPTLPSSPTLIPDEELDEYFNAPITHPAGISSSPVQ